MSVSRSSSQASVPVPGLSYGDINSVQMVNFTATHRVLNAVHEWSFPFSFSQSNMHGRNGSNACTFIALSFGKTFVDQKLLLPMNHDLDTWINGLHYAIIKGNQVHDALFDNDAVNLSVQDTVEMAGDEFGVKGLGQQVDFFGRNSLQDVSEYICRLASKQERQCIGIVTCGRTMLFTIDEHKAVGLIDSHQHGVGTGAIIACVSPKFERNLIAWFNNMMQQFWNCELSTCSLTVIQY